MAMTTETETNEESLSTVVVIPAHNEGAFIGALLDSLEHYGPPDAQIIVVDNGSTDETAKVAIAHGVTVARVQSKVFPAIARNIGVEHSDPKKKIIVFLDADVELTPQWQEEWLTQINSLKMNPMQITGAACDVSKNPSWIERVWFAPMRNRKISYVPGANIITTRILFSTVNGFDTRLETGEDVDLCARARRLGASVLVNNGFKVHHEGFPRDIAHFLKRERWHGKGDLASFRHAVHSRVMRITAVFITLHALGIGAAVDAATTGGSYLMTWICLAGITAVCVAGAMKVVGNVNRAPNIGAIAIMYVYYVGRALSIWDTIRRAMFPPRFRNRRTRNAG